MKLPDHNKFYNTLKACAVFAVLFLSWQLASHFHLISPVLLPSPESVYQALKTLLLDGQMGAALEASITRILLGFLFSALIAVPAGLWLGFSKSARAALEPTLAFLRYIPPSAFIPLMIVWFGVTETQKIALIFLAIAPYFCLMIADAAAATKPELISAAMTLGASKKDIFWKVVFPHSLPATWDSGRIMFGASWSFVIIAEIVGSNKGLGHLIVESQRYLKTANIFAAMLAIGLIGLFSDLLLQTLSKRIFPWFYHHAPH